MVSMMTYEVLSICVGKATGQGSYVRAAAGVMIPPLCKKRKTTFNVALLSVILMAHTYDLLRSPIKSRLARDGVFSMERGTRLQNFVATELLTTSLQSFFIPEPGGMARSAQCPKPEP